MRQVSQRPYCEVGPDKPRQSHFDGSQELFRI